MKNRKKRSFRLYDFDPAVMVLLLSPIGFLPLIGGLAVNLLFSAVAVLMIQKRFRLKTVLKTAGVSYITSLSVLLSGVVAVWWLGFLVFAFVFGIQETYDGRVYPHAVETAIEMIWFVVGTGAIFAVSFLYTAKQFFGGVKHRTRSRVIIAVLLTLLNAPYLLFIPYEQAVYVDYNRYSKFVDEKAHEEQRSWESDDGILSFNTVERFHRFRAAGAEGGLLNCRFDSASASDKTFTISFNDWVADTGGYYNSGDFRVYYRSSESNSAYRQLFSGSYYRSSADKLVLEVKAIDSEEVKTPYKAGDTIYLHTV